jgi:hypothetical protein
MTDHDHDRLLPVPDDDALDAAACAVVDGVATPEEAAAVAAAPDGAARVAAQRAVAAAVGAPVGHQRTAVAASGLAAALATFGEETFSADRPSAPIAPTPIAPSRSRRSLPRLGAVAAALLLLVGIGTFAVALIDSDGPTGSDDSTTFAAPPPAKGTLSEAAGTPERAQGSPGLGGPAPAPAAPPGAGAAAAPTAANTRDALAAAPTPAVVNGGDIGRQGDTEAVAQRVSTALNGTPTVAAADGEAALPREIQACATAAPSTSPESLGPLRYRATGSFEGTPAVFLAYERPAGSPAYLLLILARDGCSLLATSHF